jgi:hypothetical protein
MPSLIAQEATPSLGALLVDGMGAQGLLALLVGLAAFNLLLVVTLYVVIRLQRSTSRS